MRSKGLIPKGVSFDEPYAIAANVVDAVKWQDQKLDELKKMMTQDVQQKNRSWHDELSENFLTFGLTPSNTSAEVETILTAFKEELEKMEDAGNGVDCRNYLFNLVREIDLLVEKA